MHHRTSAAWLGREADEFRRHECTSRTGDEKEFCWNYTGYVRLVLVCDLKRASDGDFFRDVSRACLRRLSSIGSRPAEAVRPLDPMEDGR
jgi:hypothetical protein